MLINHVQRLLLPGCLALACSQNAFAGCIINVSVTNLSPHPVRVYNHIKSSVKTKGGLWRDLHRGGWGPSGKENWQLAAGATYTDTYNAVSGCNNRRQYRIMYACPSQGGGVPTNRVEYWPSARRDSASQTINVDLPAC